VAIYRWQQDVGLGDARLRGRGRAAILRRVPAGDAFQTWIRRHDEYV
jgi:hypothetical protein